MINVQIKDSTTVELDLSGKVTGDDYKHIRPELERVFKENGRQKFLFDINRADSITLGGMYEDLKFDLQHFKYVGTTAVVGTKTMAETLTQIADKLYPVKIKHFEDKSAAFEWLKSQEA